MQVAIGAGIGCSNGRPGTLGPLLSKQGSTAVFGLTCSHVLSADCIGKASCSDHICPCLMQSPHRDFVDSSAKIGDSIEYCRPLSTSGENQEDFGIFQISADVTPLPGLLLDGFSPVPSGSAEVSLVRSSGNLAGSIDDSSGQAVELKLADLPFAAFKYRGLVRVRYNAATQGGNSGALVFLTSSRKAVGIHVAGDAGFGYFFPIAAFLTAKGFSLFHR